jgi:hypothetical protein
VLCDYAGYFNFFFWILLDSRDWIWILCLRLNKVVMFFFLKKNMLILNT